MNDSTRPCPTARPALVEVVSGGQTGVDRAALDAAIQLGIAHGGWCPRGRRAEDGVIPSCYLLSENESRNYAVRTRQNVTDSDATLILHGQELSGGTLLTFRFARNADKPCRVVCLDEEWSLHEIARWIRDFAPCRLNVAGPRESSQPGIYQNAYSALVAIFDHTLHC